jgi:hypothetical protein
VDAMTITHPPEPPFRTTGKGGTISKNRPSGMLRRKGVPGQFRQKKIAPGIV